MGPGLQSHDGFWLQTGPCMPYGLWLQVTPHIYIDGFCEGYPVNVPISILG